MKSNFKGRFRRKKLSLDNPKELIEVEKNIYQEFLRKGKSDIPKEKYIDCKHLENIFTTQTYYQAMKDLSDKEKIILYYCFYENKQLNEVSETIKCSKDEVVKLKKQAIQHFKENIEKYQKLYFKKNGGVYCE